MLLSKPLNEDPRVVREANSLQEAGHDVVVLQWARFDPEAAREDEIAGIPVVRFPLPAMARALPTTLLRTPAWWRSATKQALRLHEQQPFDVVHAHDLDTLPVGVRLKRRHGVRLVYDAHEIFAHMIQGDHRWPVPQAADRLEHRLLQHVDHLVTAGDGFAEHYAALYKGPITVTRNALWGPPGLWEPPTHSQFTVVYIGTLSRDRMFPQIVPALADIHDVQFLLGGKKEGVYHKVEEAARHAAGVTFLGPVPHQEVIEHTRHSHAVVVPMDPANPQYRTQLANKVYDAMSAGRPLIGVKGTATGEFAREHGFGITVDYDAQAMRAAVTALAEDPDRATKLGKTGHMLAQTEYHWGPQGQRLVAAYEQL